MSLMRLLVTDTFEQTVMPKHSSYKLLGLSEYCFIYPASILTYLLSHPDHHLPSTLLEL